MNTHKPLPQNIEAEKNVLGAVFLDNACLPKILDILSHESFYRISHKQIFAAMMALFQKKEPIDLLTVSDTLRKEKQLKDVGGTDYLASLEENTPTTTQAPFHAKIIREKHVLRELIKLTINVSNESYGESSEVQKILKGAERTITSLSNIFSTNMNVDMANVYDAERMLKEYRNYIETLSENSFKTGINEIDRYIRGVAGGEVLTILARAGSFKTANLQNFLLNFVQNSAWGAVFFSLEMPVASVVERYHGIISGDTGGNIEYIYRRPGGEETVSVYEKKFMKGLKNLFVIPVKVSISDIAAYIKLIEAKRRMKIGLVGIDYLGLLDSPGFNEYEIISKLSRDIKTMAKMINLPVILLSQVSRKGGDGGIEISLDMGRGSGAIEEGADFILGLWQTERELNSYGEPEYDLICRILKNRKGSKGSRWKLNLNPSTLKIGPTALKYEPPKNKKGIEY